MQTSGASATNNTVRLRGAAQRPQTEILGSFYSVPSSIPTGNLLSVENTGIQVGAIANFQNYHFIFPSTIADGQIMLTVLNDSANIPGPVDLSQSTVTLAFAGGGGLLQVGDAVILIDHQQNSLIGTPLNTHAIAQQGISLLYDFELSADSGKLVAKLSSIDDLTPPITPILPGITVHPQTQALLEGQLASFAFLGRGQDLMVRSAFK